MTDYTVMDAPTMLSAVGDDAYKWASAFVQLTAEYDHPVDHGDMIGWFANAIESSYDLRSRKTTDALRKFALADARYEQFKHMQNRQEEMARKEYETALQQLCDLARTHA